MITHEHYLAVAAVLFTLGLIGAMARRNLITIFLSVELMVQAVVLNLVAYARYHADLHGQALALFAIAIAACESGIAMALFIALYRRRRTLDASDWQELRETGVPATVDSELMALPPEDYDDPKLQVAGTVPDREEAARV